MSTSQKSRKPIGVRCSIVIAKSSSSTHRLTHLLDMIGCSEDEAIRALLGAFSPYQPGSLRQKLLERQERFGRDVAMVPSTAELWELFEAANYRCTRCHSQLRITIDRIDAASGYERTNLRVLCADCNRALSRGDVPQQELSLQVFLAISSLLDQQPSRFPSDADIRTKTGIKSFSGSTYLVRFLRARWLSDRGRSA